MSPLVKMLPSLQVILFIGAVSYTQVPLAHVSFVQTLLSLGQSLSIVHWEGEGLGAWLTLGTKLGTEDGSLDVTELGMLVGSLVDSSDGTALGSLDGTELGSKDSTLLGSDDGENDGSENMEGAVDGARV